MKYLCWTAALAMLPASAQAASMSSLLGSPDAGARPGQTMMFDFNSATPELSGDYSLVSGTTSKFAAPAGDGSQYAVVPTSGMPRGSATLDLTGFVRPILSFSFYWGSIDTYNSIELLSGSTSFAAFSGTSIWPANGDQHAAVTNRRVNFVIDRGQALTGVRFNSGGVAFEIDDFAVAAVPDTSVWVTLLMGFSIIGYAARHGQKRHVAAA